MTTRSLTRPEALIWGSLPTEIRLMILETIAFEKYTGWASFASVCREWQDVLEKVNFYKMNLRVSCLDDFEHIISPQKRRLIHHICLDVELPRYFSPCCLRRHSPSGNINRIVSDGIWKLFSLLSTWGPVDNLALEINARSPSDCEHWFKNLYFSSDDVEHDEDAMLDACKTGTAFHDPQHGWMHGQQVGAPPKSAMFRLFQTIWLASKETLPRVQAVTHFIIRRQLRRYIPPAGLGLLLSRLDRLEHISYEPWAPFEDANKAFYDRGTHSLLYRELPPSYYIIYILIIHR